MANNKVLIASTAITVPTWTMNGLANGAGRVSSQIDLGPASRPRRFRWDAVAVFNATGLVQYEELEFYAAGTLQSDNTKVHGALGVTDTALSDTNQVRNLDHIGSVVVEDVTTNEMIAGSEFEFSGRYLSLVGFNNAGGSLTTLSFTLEQIPDEIE